jgi:CheY-like chemotaxis protein
VPRGQDEFPSLRDVHVLVVDDDADTREMLKSVLEDCGADVSLATSAGETLQALDRSIPDVLICDVGMPDTDGYALMQQVRARTSDRGGSVPAVALTGYTTVEDRARAVSVGYQRHLAKPVEPFDLTRVVAELVEGGPARAGSESR